MIPFGEAELRDAGMLVDERRNWEAHKLSKPELDGLEVLAMVIIVVAMACPIILGVELLGFMGWLIWKVWAG